jgi:hypothetical protein
MKTSALLITVFLSHMAFAEYPFVTCARWIGEDDINNTYAQTVYDFYLDDESVRAERGRYDGNSGYTKVQELFSGGELKSEGKKITFQFKQKIFVFTRGVSPELIPRYYDENWPPDYRPNVGVGRWSDEADVLFRCELNK